MAAPPPPLPQQQLQLRFAFLQVVEESLIERRNEDVSCCQSCEQALLRANGWAPRKMQIMQYLTVTTPQFCITHCLECFPSKKCIPELFQDFLLAS